VRGADACHKRKWARIELLRRVLAILFALLTSIAMTPIGSGSSTRVDIPTETNIELTESPGPAQEVVQPQVAGGFVGANGHLLWKDSSEGDLDFMAEGGVTWLRSDFDWALLEPARGEYRWRWSDQLMRGASQAGVEVLAIIDYSTPWASSDPSGAGDVHYPPTNATDFAGFAAAVANRYGLGGEFWRDNPQLQERPITALEIWNEPFGHWFWKPNPDVARYAELVRTTVAAVREVQPEMTILIAGDALEYRTDGQRPWLERLLEAAPDLAQLVDVWSIHAYSDPPGLAPWVTPTDPRYGVRGRVEDSLRISQDNDARLPVWITETGWCTGGGGCGVVSDQDQSDYLVDVIQSASTTWSEGVDKIFVYSIDISSGVPGDREGTYGLRAPDGSPKPAWIAISSLIRGSE